MDQRSAQRMDGFEARLVLLEKLLGVVRSEPVTTDAPGSPVTPLPRSSLEQLIGLKWTGWVGAVVLVIGAALGMEFAYQQGWFAVVTPAVGMVLLALGGFALIAGGEWVYRKINTLSAVGLFGSGVAILFAVSYAGHRFYDLYTTRWAFAFMGLCTLIGAGVARRGRLVSIAVLSLIGGALAPLLAQPGPPGPFRFSRLPAHAAKRLTSPGGLGSITQMVDPPRAFAGDDLDLGCRCFTSSPSPDAAGDAAASF